MLRQLSTSRYETHEQQRYLSFSDKSLSFDNLYNPVFSMANTNALHLKKPKAALAT